MRNKFDNELIELNNNLTHMGALCENAITLAIEALLDGNSEKLKQVSVLENQIDEKERIIESQCLRLILQQQPIATDLRVISAALKMITDIERIGDQAFDIASLSKYTQIGNIPNLSHIKQMAEETVKMVKDSIEAFVKRDEALAKEVMEYDDKIDELFHIVKKDILDAIKTGKADDSESIIDILMIAKYFEKIGDHATNIAEWVVFTVTGVHKGEVK